jgi:hypothetical protein
VKVQILSVPFVVDAHGRTVSRFISGSNRIADIDVNESKATARITDDRGNVVVVFMGGGGYFVPQPEETKAKS